MPASSNLALLKRCPFILASASPRRRDLLTEQGYEFIIKPADVTEIAPPHFTPAETVLYNARLKASSLASQNPDTLVVGIDTLVALEGRIFGKPTDMAEAEWMLSQLNGRAHEVFSGVSLIRRSTGQERAFVEVTEVRFRALSAEARLAYLHRIGPLDKAGAYAAQDDKGEIIASVEGSFSNVVGLPMETFGRVIREFYSEG